MTTRKNRCWNARYTVTFKVLLKASEDQTKELTDAEVGEAFRGAVCEANTYSNAQALIQESLKEEGLSWGYSFLKWDECSCEERG